MDFIWKFCKSFCPSGQHVGWSSFKGQLTPTRPHLGLEWIQEGPLIHLWWKTVPLSGPQYSFLEASGSMGNQIRIKGHCIDVPWNHHHSSQKPRTPLVYKIAWPSEDGPKLKQGSEMEGVWNVIKVKDSISQWVRAGQKIIPLDTSYIYHRLHPPTHHPPIHHSISSSNYPSIHPSVSWSLKINRS